MKRKKFEEWFKKTGYSLAHESSINPLMIPMMNAFDANSDYIEYLEKQNEILLEVVKRFDNLEYNIFNNSHTCPNGKCYACDFVISGLIADGALEKIKEMG